MSRRDASLSVEDRLAPAATVLLVASSCTAILVVPGLPYLQLDEPGHWGLVAYLVAATLFVRHRHADWRPGSVNRLNACCVLVGMPAIYVAYASLHGANGLSVIWELAGLVFWMVLAPIVGRRVELSWIGVLLHAIWDAAHFGRTDYVPDWYSAACLAADIGLAGFMLIALLTTARPLRGALALTASPSS